MNQSKTATDFLQVQQPGVQYGGGILGFAQGQQLASQAAVTIPMAPDNWKKLSRDTQLRMLDELGILNQAKAIVKLDHER